MKPVVFHDEAGAELDEAIVYYEKQREGLGLEFLAVVQETIVQIQENPELGAPYKATRFRHFVIRRFPYILFYADLDEAHWIIAVAHGKRRPDYWRRRTIP